VSHGERGSQVREKRVTRKIFGLKTDKAAAEWRKLHTAGLDDFCSSPNISRAIKRWRMTWAGRGEVHVGFWLGDLRERDHLENLSVDGDNIKTKKYVGRIWTGFI